MHWRSSVALLTGLGCYLHQAGAQVVTITQYPSTCRAIYTSGTRSVTVTPSRSVTIIQSTVTVSPVPWTDDLANGGTPFVLQAIPSYEGSKKRQASAPRWIARDGYLTTDGTKAAQYIIRDDMLTTATGDYITTDSGIANKTFALAARIGTISRRFTIEEGGLRWSNTAFEDGTAALYQTKDSAQTPARAVAWFYGPIGDDWTPIELTARPVNAALPSGYLSSGVSTTSIISSIGADMSSMRPSNEPGIPSDAYTPPVYSYQPTTGNQNGQTSATRQATSTRQTSAPETPASTPVGNPDSSVAQSPAASPSATLPTSPEGICGGESGFKCSNSDCCGQYGYCGIGDEYCGAGCQASFGYCSPTPSSSEAPPVQPTSYPPGISIPSPSPNPASSSRPSSVATPSSSPDLSSVAVPTSGPNAPTAPSASPSVPAASMIPSGTSEAVSATDAPPAYNSFACPRDNAQTVTDSNGIQYQLACGRDTTVGSYASSNVQNGFNECFGLCDEAANCMAFTYQGGANGIGFGICYLKNQPSEFTGTDEGMVGAIRVARSPASSSATARSSDGMPSGAAPYSTTVTSSSLSTALALSTYTAAATPIGPDNPGGPYDDETTSSMSMSMDMTMSGMPDVTSSYSSAPSPTLPVSPNGHCGTGGNGGTPEGFTCTGSVFGACCSSSGYCGDTADYCLAGCQTSYGECTPQDGNPITVNGRCGTDWDNQTCTGGIFGPCCSTSGYCGSTSEYCMLPNCDLDFGNCYDALSSSVVMEMSSTSLMALTTSSMQMDTPPASSMEDAMSSTSSASSSTVDAVEETASTSSPAADVTSSSSAAGESIDPYPSPSSSPTSTSSSSAASSTVPSSSSASPSPSSSSAVVTTTTTSTTSSSSPAITTTTTRTTTTTTSTSSSTSTMASPHLALPSPTPCNFGDPPGVDEDDSYCKITLPFAVQIYGQSDANTYASTNGFLSVQYGGAQYASQQLPASNLPNNTIAPFFDDLELQSSAVPMQGVFYQVQGTSVTYEWYVGRAETVGQVYHFTVKYDSVVPGVFTITYYSTGGTADQGLFAAIGTQGKDLAGAQTGFTYAYHTQSITPGLVLVCNTSLNTCVTQR